MPKIFPSKVTTHNAVAIIANNFLNFIKKIYSAYYEGDFVNLYYITSVINRLFLLFKSYKEMSFFFHIDYFVRDILQDKWKRNL